MITLIKDINVRLIAKIIGYLLVYEALFMMLAVAVGWLMHPPESPELPVAAATTLLSGLTLSLIHGDASKQLGRREGVIIVSFSWVIISFFGALPYYLGGLIPSFTDAFFETMSGFTATGSSVIADVERIPPEILLWRSLTHWLGGMGIIVFSVALLPKLGIGGMQLFEAEMTGVTHDKLHPRITSTAKRLWGIYLLLTLLAFLMLWAGEMNWFDALNHAFSTMATGGFSTKNNSIAAFGAYSQYVIALFMILAGTNFTLHYFSLNGWFRQVFRDEEYRAYLLLLIVPTFIIGIGLVLMRNTGIEEAFRSALFTTASILSTTGFLTENYLAWPVSLSIFLFLLMFVGGMAGSTSGGITVIRQLLLLKNSLLELPRSIHPNAVLPVRYNKKNVPQAVIQKVMVFFLLYILLFVAGILTLTIIGLDFNTSVAASLASIGNIGPGVLFGGAVQTYAWMPDMAKWVLTLLMLLGRLEIFTLIMMTSKDFWRK